jgi:hypothetical protein
MAIKRKREQIKELLVEWCSSSTSHGIPNIVRTENWSVKILWSIFVLLSTAFCAFMVTRAVLDYLKNDVVTKIRVYKEIPAEFPTITICNINPLTSVYVNERWNQNYENWFKQSTLNYEYYFYINKKYINNGKINIFLETHNIAKCSICFYEMNIDKKSLYKEKQTDVIDDKLQINFDNINGNYEYIIKIVCKMKNDTWEYWEKL